MISFSLKILLNLLIFKSWIPKNLYVFCSKNDEGNNEYEKGIKLIKLFLNFTSGIVTANDSLTVLNNLKELDELSNKILNSENPFIEFNIKDSRWASKEQRLEDLKYAKIKVI